MTRRELLVGTVGAALTSVMGANPPVKYGRMDVDRWMKEGHFGKRVLVSGVDVTMRCRMFDDTEGVALCFLLDGSGNIRIDEDGEPLSQIVRGHVEVVG